MGVGSGGPGVIPGLGVRLRLKEEGGWVGGENCEGAK